MDGDKDKHHKNAYWKFRTMIVMSRTATTTAGFHAW